MMNLTEKQRGALSELLAGPKHLSVGLFTPLRNLGLIEKAEDGPSAGRGMVWSKITAAGSAAII